MSRPTVILAATLAALLFPSTAWAWGPAAHLDFSVRLMADLPLMIEPIRLLLERYPKDFLYGSLAADIIVGKNLKGALANCHRFDRGFALVREADGDAQKAMALGFVGHLAADVVAHNYFIPFKMAKNYRSRVLTHIYWESRFDSLLGFNLFDRIAELEPEAIARHDAYLNEKLAMTLLPFSVNKKIFDGVLLNERFNAWHKMSERFNSYTDLTVEDVKIYRRWALASMRDILNRMEESPMAANDPTGRANLRFAGRFRRELRRRFDRGEISYESLERKILSVRANLLPALESATPVSVLLEEFGEGRPARYANVS